MRRHTKIVMAKRAVKTTAVAGAIVALASLLNTTSPSFASVSPNACGPIGAKPAGYPGAGTNWTCTFDDEFNGTSVNYKTWETGDTSKNSFMVDDTCYQPNKNITVSGGIAHFSITPTPAGFLCTTPTGAAPAKYIGSNLDTSSLFSQTYGKFEVRMAYSPYATAGLHGNFWLYPQDSAYGAWPASGEIDTNEWWSQYPTYEMPTLHYFGSNSTYGSAGHMDTGYNCHPSNPAAFNTYGIVWGPTSMTFYLNGTACFTDSWTAENTYAPSQPFDKRFFLVLTLAGSGIVPSNYQSNAMKVDYVRAWK